jgi:lantibiotic modifying enzyme
LKNWFCRKRSISGLGLAGIGYFFLRLANPAAVPSIMLTVPDHYYHPA